MQQNGVNVAERVNVAKRGFPGGRTAGAGAAGSPACSSQPGAAPASDDALHEECGVFGVWAPGLDVARTFIQPTQELRTMGVRMKLNPLRDMIAGKRLVVIDDSIVRGTTMVQLVSMLRQAGAREVHVRVNSPEVKWPCFYGIDTDVQAQLISANKSVEEIRAFIGADSLAFLSVEGLLSCVPPVGRAVPGASGSSCGYCTACFTGVYPVAIPPSFGRDKFMEGFDPFNLTQVDPVTGHCVVDKEHDHRWEREHEA